MNNKDNQESNNTTLHILAVLENGEKYGYEITDEISSITNGKLVIKQATLYTNLKKLEQKSFISSYWKDSDIGGKRHYYYITDAGKEFLKASSFNPTPFKEILKSNVTDLETINTTHTYVSDNIKTFWTDNNVASIDTDYPSNDLKKPNEETKPPLVVSDFSQPTNKETNSQNNPIQHIGDEELKKEQDCKDAYQSAKQSCDARILDKSETLQINEKEYAMEDKPYNTTSNIDIDYKAILGELYCDKEMLEKSKSNTIENDEFTSIENDDNYTEDCNDNADFETSSNEEIISNDTNNAINTFDNYKIKVKKHTKLYRSKLNNDGYVKSNKLNFAVSIIGYILFVISLLVSTNCFVNFSEINMTFVIIFAILPVVYPIVMGIIFVLDVNKKKRKVNNLINNEALLFLICLVVMIFSFSICLLCGMTNMNQAKYILFWLIPAILSINLLLLPIIKFLLIKTKKFNG